MPEENFAVESTEKLMQLRETIEGVSKLVDIVKLANPDLPEEVVHVLDGQQGMVTAVMGALANCNEHLVRSYEMLDELHEKIDQIIKD